MIEAAIAARPLTATRAGCIRPASIFSIPVDRATLFSDSKGVYANRVESRQRKLIVKSTFIKTYLHDGEHICCLTTGHCPVSTIERELTGPAYRYFKRALLVFTNMRILHIPTRFNHTPRGAVSQIPYDGCTALAMKGGALEVIYRSGEKEVFNGIGRRERKKLRAFIADLGLPTENPGRNQGRTHLCPRCTAVLTDGEMRCVCCNLAFKSRQSAALWSFLVPGGSLFYLRHRLAGGALALFEIALLAFVVASGSKILTGGDYGLAALGTAWWIMVKLLGVFFAGQMVREYVPASPPSGRHAGLTPAKTVMGYCPSPMMNRS